MRATSITTALCLVQCLRGPASGGMRAFLLRGLRAAAGPGEALTSTPSGPLSMNA